MKNKAAILLLLMCFLSGVKGNVAAQDNSLGFSITDATITEKDTFTVAINADSLLTGRNVLSYRFEIVYSTYYFEFLGVDDIGTLLNAWGTPEVNGNVPGRVKLAGAGETALSGSGTMIYLKFRAIVRWGDWLRFNSVGSYLNEGDPSMSFTDIHIQINQLSLPNISPDSRTLFVGEETQLSVSGGTEPYVFSVLDTSIAVITEQTKVRAKAPGFTKIMVTDDKGETSVTTGNYEVRAIRMSLERISSWPKDTFYLPVKIDIAPGTTIYSGIFELSHNGNLTGLKDEIQSADFNLNLQRNASGNVSRISFASVSGISGSGILCYLPFIGNNSGNHTLSFSNTSFNETLNSFNTNNYVIINALPTLTFSPNSGNLMWGETQKVTVGNGTAPYTLNVSNNEIAEIDNQGNLTALSGGSVTITAVDDHGATRTSGIFTINDNRFSIANTSGALNNTVRVQLTTSALPDGKSIVGFEGQVQYNPTYLTFTGIEQGNNGMLVEYVEQTNSFNFAGATSTGIQSGIVCYFLFEIKNTLELQAETSILLNSISANEGTLNVLKENGKIKRIEQTSYKPVARAGNNFSVKEGDSAQLNGTGSFDEDDDGITYLWTAPEGITLDDATLVNPTFTAPEVDVNTPFLFTLVVNDGKDDSDPSEVTVTVLQVNKAPVAYAGPDASYLEGTNIKLDGKGSFDVDGDPISYVWTSLDGIILFDKTSATPSFIAPQVDIDTKVRFYLVVNDGALSSERDTVTITIAQLNKKPIAFAGGDMTVDEGVFVELNGTLSSDADNNPLTYLWTAPAEVELSSTTTSKPTFTAPSVLLDSVLIFTLVVNDGILDSDPDDVLVTVKNLDELSSAALIDSVSLADINSFSIDTLNNIVTLNMAYGYDISELNPFFKISENARISPANGSTRNFAFQQTYTVTAEDGNTRRVWTVKVNLPQNTVTRNLEEGWSWISLNVTPSDLDINSLFPGSTSTELDYLKSKKASAVYYNSGGWFGDLTEFPVSEMVKYHRENTGILEVSGSEINPSIQKIPISTGWNSLGYVLNKSVPLTNAFVSSTLPSGDIILKSDRASAIYYPASGWTGDLDSMKVLNGYKLKAESNANLQYDASAVSTKSASLMVNKHGDLLETYNINPHNYEYSNTIIAEIVDANGNNIVTEGDLLLAKVNDIPRGVTQARYVVDLDRSVFILSSFSNNPGEMLTLDYITNNKKESYTSLILIPFSEDEVLGQALKPLPLSLNQFTPVRDAKKDGLLLIYPNPVQDHLILSASTEIQQIAIYNALGSLVELTNHSGTVVNKKLTNLSPGIYNLHVHTSEGILIRKIVKASN